MVSTPVSYTHLLVRDTDEGGRKQALIRDLTALVEAYQSGVIAQGVAQEM